MHIARQLTWFVFPRASTVTWLGISMAGSSNMFKFSIVFVARLFSQMNEGQDWVAIKWGSFKYTTITEMLSLDPDSLASWQRRDAILL